MTAVGSLVAAALGLLCAAAVAGRRRPRAWLGLNASGCAALLAAALVVLIGRTRWEWRGGPSLGGERVHLLLDGLGALFLALVAVLGGAGALYASESFTDRARPDAAPRGRSWWSALVLGMALVLLCANGLHFLIAWEAFALASFFLITLERERRGAAAGWLYLAASHAGTLALFAFFALLAQRTGGFELGPMRDRPELAPLLWLALLGFGVKAGVFPLHVWVPSTYAAAPSHVSALLSGAASKLGIYGILRFSGWLAAPPGGGWAVLGIGAVCAAAGAAFSLAQTDLKRLLAYASVENAGVTLVGLGAAMLGAASGASFGRVALAGALLHVWNDGLSKSLLFLGAGSIERATGTRELSRLGGAWRRMPWTAGAFALGAAALCGLPPLNAFVSEWLIYSGLLRSAAERGPAAAATLLGAIALALAGALALAAFLKASALALLGAPRARGAAEARECGRPMRAAMVLLGALCVLLALAPVLGWRLAESAVGAWRPQWAGAPTPDALRALGWTHLWLAAALAAATAALLARARAARARRAPTWDCGYAAPTARMQISAGSFGAVATGWFRFVLRPERRLRRPRGAFPSAADHAARVPETVLERVLAPVGGAVMLASAWVRRRQHGRLQDYVLYLVAGLAAIGALVLSWSVG